MLLLILATLFSYFQGLLAQTDANGVSLADKVLQMERMLLTPQQLLSIVTPCKFLQNGSPFSGEQTSAEWVRIVFHDFVTANITAGTGGIDASIGFETERAENTGLVFINATIGQFNQFFSVYTPMSDLIALGLADSLISCGGDGRLIGIKVGRIDAPGPGPSGVPQPQDTLASQTAAFANAGLSATEMIQAVACGHSLGSVHQVNFPSIVPESYITVNDTDGADHFDSTPAIFDNVGVNEYLNGSGQAGGPLVVGPNITTRSDLRIFSSDGNATIKAMLSPSAFENTCYTIFEKMLNTVPKTVTLSSVIGPRPWVTRESHLDLLSTGAVAYSGSITTHGTTPPSPTASYYYGTVGGGNTGLKSVPISVNGTQQSVAFGTITDYGFNDTMNSNQITSINIQGSFTEAINLNIFVLVSRSFQAPFSAEQPFVIRAAVLGTLATTKTTLTGTMYYGISQPDTFTPKLITTTFPLTYSSSLGIYKIFEGPVTLPVTVEGGTAGIRHVNVKLGTTQTSAKVDTSLFTFCSNPDLTTCVN